MTRALCCLLLLTLSFSACRGKNKKPDLTDNKVLKIPSIIAEKANDLIVSIRDNKIDNPSATKEFSNSISVVRNSYYKSGGQDYFIQDWVFPLKGYNSKAIGGEDGSGYIFGSYDFFDGNRHTGHPALDIFISDGNQDCLDDNSKNEVPILSVSGGVVMAAAFTWDTASSLRGGKYIWIFDPTNNFLIYYAHNKKVNVSIGQIVKPGDQIATCGRTGLNAYKKRSPTHLHFMLLKLDENDYPKPINPYNYLKNTKTL